jgi:bifunctional DNA-binding transcriptional regulator/antitoxin component of YhaV-PrlF toxin-antitoxin module
MGGPGSKWGRGKYVGDLHHIWGLRLAEIKKVDAQGRISLPARWRSKRVDDSGEVIVIEKGDVLLVKPNVKPDLTRHFDSVETQADPEDFTDYSILKKAVLGRRTK